MPLDPLLIFGAGGHAKVVAEVARATGGEVVGFLEDGDGRDGVEFFGSRIIAWDRFVAEGGHRGGIGVALAIGDNAGRAGAFGRIRALGRGVATLVHPSAVVSPSASLGEGTVVLPAAVVHSDARVGIGVILNTGSITEHDARVGDFAHLSPKTAVGGRARIGARVHLGIGAVVLPRVEIGDGATVGAGAVVLHEVAPGTTVVGIPARPLHPGLDRP